VVCPPWPLFQGVCESAIVYLGSQVCCGLPSAAHFSTCVCAYASVQRIEGGRLVNVYDCLVGSG